MDPRPWPSQVKLVVALLLLAGVLIVLYVLRMLLSPLAVSILLASILRIPVNYLERRTGLPRALLTVFTFLAVLALLALTPALLAPRIIASVSELQVNLADAWQRIQAWAAHPVAVVPGLAFVPQDVFGPVLGSIQGALTPLAGSVFSVAGRLATSVVWGIFVIVVTFWLVKDYRLMFRYLRSLVPAPYQEEFARLGAEIARTWDAFLRGQFTLALVIGMILSIALWILGMPSPFVLGIFSGFMEFIPTLGPVIGWTLAVTLALLQGSSWLPINNLLFALIITVLYVLVFQLDSVFLIPRIVGRRVRLHPLVVFVGLIGGAMVAGVVGVILAAPTIATARVLVRYLYRKLLDLPPFPPETPLLAPGKGWWQPERAARVQAVLFDLDGTLFETDDAIVEQLARGLRPLARLLEFDARAAARRVVMGLEGVVNGVITFLDVLHLDGIAFWVARKGDHLLHGSPHPQRHRLTPGAEALLAHLRPHFRLGVVTTRSHQETEHMLKAAGLQPYFDVIVTRDDSRRLKPHPGPIRLAAERLNLPPEHILVVGDTPLDVRAAKAAGAMAAAVLCGFGEIEELQDADIIVENPAELAHWLPVRDGKSAGV